MNRSFLEATATMVVFGENYIHALMTRRKGEAQCSLQWEAAGTEFSEKTEAEFKLFRLQQTSNPGYKQQSPAR